MLGNLVQMQFSVSAINEGHVKKEVGMVVTEKLSGTIGIGIIV